ncbi:MAG: UbiA prenyltransferase family protein [Candidatus Hodarchaeota archaeon]
MFSKIKNTLTLLRIRQYYKNGLVFVGIFFSERLFDFSVYFTLIMGFILLCCASSFNYVINDIKDIDNDKKHPEKMRKKPLASGELSITFAVLLIFFLLFIIIISLLFLIPNWNFMLMLVLIIVTGQMYNYLFKFYAFIDILVLSIGYIWRALAGCLIIEEYISAWLFLAIFEIAMFLSIAKRRGDLHFLGKDKAIKHKNVYDQYSLKLLDHFHVIISGSLFITYSLYLIFKFNLFVPESVVFYEYIAIFTIPLSLYIIMRYLYLTSAKPKIARSPEKIVLDKGIVLAGTILLIILFISFYFDNIIQVLNSILN